MALLYMTRYIFSAVTTSVCRAVAAVAAVVVVMLELRRPVFTWCSCFAVLCLPFCLPLWLSTWLAVCVCVCVFARAWACRPLIPHGAPHASFPDYLDGKSVV